MNKWKNLFYILIQWTWGFVQNLIGLIVFLIFYKYKHIKANNVVFTEIPGNWGGITLGGFVFIDYLPDDEIFKDSVVRHEYGHTIQSLYLGPLWLFIIGLPSLLWAGCFDKYRAKYKVSYYDFYTEKWANYLGDTLTQKEE